MSGTSLSLNFSSERLTSYRSLEVIRILKWNTFLAHNWLFILKKIFSINLVGHWRFRLWVLFLFYYIIIFRYFKPWWILFSFNSSNILISFFDSVSSWIDNGRFKLILDIINIKVSKLFFDNSIIFIFIKILYYVIELKMGFILRGFVIWLFCVLDFYILLFWRNRKILKSCTFVSILISWLVN